MFRLNLVAIVIGLIAGSVAFGLQAVIGFTGDGGLLLIAGSLCVALDLLYRARYADAAGWRRWFGLGGGIMIFFPIWLWGGVMLVASIWEFLGLGA